MSLRCTIEQQLEEINFRIKYFILECSSLNYLEDSDAIVSEGVHLWNDLEEKSREIQYSLLNDYRGFINQNIEYIDDKLRSHFFESVEHVCVHIEQNDFVWHNNLEDVYTTIQRELKVQFYLFTQSLSAGK
ncbi:hypothetical protein C0Q44_22700 [Paenibacillus sp. PCH8]|nr:hypothetical protein C0Q44_22700 [Paenibacillus sp. PCH8]